MVRTLWHVGPLPTTPGRRPGSAQGQYPLNDLRPVGHHVEIGLADPVQCALQCRGVGAATIERGLDLIGFNDISGLRGQGTAIVWSWQKEAMAGWSPRNGCEIIGTRL